METTSEKVISHPLPTPGSLHPKGLERLFARMLRGLRGGSLLLTFPSGAVLQVGEATGLSAELKICDARFFRQVFSGGSVGFGEAYVAGYWASPDLTAVLSLFAQNQQDMGRLRQGFSWLAQAMNRWYHRARRNTVAKSRENIQQHYDLSNDFYATFLDASMTYSSACFETAEMTLEAAQYAKMDRMLDLAGVQAGDTVLEIGSGWGALAERAAQRGCQVKTITLSDEQFAYAQARFQQAGLSGQVEISLEDYRHVSGQFDAVISCEMIEAVGREYLASYFKVIQDRLKPGGRAVIQSITIPDERYESYSRGCDWIQKHIFPGGHLPSPAAIRSHVGAAGQMQLLEMQGFGRDYAETLRRWAQAFNASAASVEQLGFDAEFCRKWNYYLSYCEAGFLSDLIDVQHVVLQRD